MFSDHESYIKYCLKAAKDKLSFYDSILKIEEDIANINVYENLDQLKEPENIYVLDEKILIDSDFEKAVNCVLEGRLFSEHAAAGEATRLGFGPKYLINIARDLPIKKIAEIISEEKGYSILAKDILKEAGCMPEQLLSLSLGTRHMLQFSFDIYNLAIRYGYDPAQVLSRQKLLVVVNEISADKIINDFVSNRFFGLERHNVLFIVQKAYHGINLVDGSFVYDEKSPRRLHNHGQMVIQQTMDEQIFRIDEKGKRKFLKSFDFGEILKEMDDKISYNIDDLDYLTGAIDFERRRLQNAHGNCQ